jgi:hypothetical protein
MSPQHFGVWLDEKRSALAATTSTVLVLLAQFFFGFSLAIGTVSISLLIIINHGTPNLRATQRPCDSGLSMGRWCFRSTESDDEKGWQLLCWTFMPELVLAHFE